MGKREFLHTLGLWYAIPMLAIRFHYAMLMALMERWDADTSMFLLPVEEMTVTLEDVYRILRLPIRGETMRYRYDHTKKNYRREKVYAMERVMLCETRGRIMVSWLLHPTDKVLLVRQLMITTLELVMCPNGHNTHMHGGLIYTIQAIERHGRVYS